MAHEDFERFRERVLGEPDGALRAELEALTDWDAFAVRVAELARRHGLDVTSADLAAARDAAARAWHERWLP